MNVSYLMRTNLQNEHIAPHSSKTTKQLQLRHGCSGSATNGRSVPLISVDRDWDVLLTRVRLSHTYQQCGSSPTLLFSTRCFRAKHVILELSTGDAVEHQSPISVLSLTLKQITVSAMGNGLLGPCAPTHALRSQLHSQVKYDIKKHLFHHQQKEDISQMLSALPMSTSKHKPVTLCVCHRPESLPPARPLRGQAS